mmetsp:Transcript_1435/g.1975  ORF Transcript_1435/g.1975 Transcript_1435/m.1975 type:complete len:198 (-) Transcript_1435:295-888(-)
MNRLPRAECGLIEPFNSIRRNVSNSENNNDLSLSAVFDFMNSSLKYSDDEPSLAQSSTSTFSASCSSLRLQPGMEEDEEEEQDRAPKFLETSAYMHHIDPIITVAEVVSNKQAFQALQADLRKSRVVTTAGTQHAMKELIETRRREQAAAMARSRRNRRQLRRAQSAMTAASGIESSDEIGFLGTSSERSSFFTSRR